MCFRARFVLVCDMRLRIFLLHDQYDCSKRIAKPHMGCHFTSKSMMRITCKRIEFVQCHLRSSVLAHASEYVNMSGSKAQTMVDDVRMLQVVSDSLQHVHLIQFGRAARPDPQATIDQSLVSLFGVRLFGIWRGFTPLACWSLPHASLAVPPCSLQLV